MTAQELKQKIVDNYGLLPKQAFVDRGMTKYQVRLCSGSGIPRAWVVSTPDCEYGVSIAGGWTTPEDAIEAARLIEIAAQIIQNELAE